MTTIVRQPRRSRRRGLMGRGLLGQPSGLIDPLDDARRRSGVTPTTTPRPAWRRILQVRLALVDTVLISLAVSAATLVAADGAGGGYTGLVAVLTAAVWGLGLVLGRAYAIDSLATGAAEYRATATAALGVAAALALGSVLLQAPVDRAALLVLLVAGVVVHPVARGLVRLFIRRSRRGGGLSDRVVVVGSPEAVDRVTRRLRAAPEAGLRVRAVATGEQDSGWFELSDQARVLQWGTAESVVPAVRAGQADVVVVADHAGLGPVLTQDLTRALDDTGARMVFVGALDDVAPARTRRRAVNGLALESVETSRFAGPRYAAKRAFDLVLTAGLVLALSPVLLLAALATLIDSGRPILFHQTRVGTDGRPFRMTKFRSMVTDAETLKASLTSDTETGNFKMRHDPRTTRVGRVLRRWSVDELPQLFDVLRGDMSLVGPRPALPAEVAEYPALTSRRLRVKPGLTGESQVSGRSELEWDDSIRKDIGYAENWSVRGDLWILVRTVRAVVGGKGAY